MTALTDDFAICATSTSLPVGEAATGQGQTEGLEGDSDLRLYQRHVEGGETIRALAREAGCHASTIMRRIRRIEARRDDPLVDQAMDQVGATGFTRGDTEQFRRILRRLAESGAQMVLADGMQKAIVVRSEIRTAILDRAIAEKIAMNGWVTLQRSGRVLRYAISAAGRDALRRLVAARRGGIARPGDFASAEPVVMSGLHEDASRFDHPDCQRVWEEREISDPEDGGRRRSRFNIAESPLQMLARRRDTDGKPFLSADLVTAGERLREDFELAQMGPRVTQNWDRFLTAGIDSSHSGYGPMGGGSDTARSRVAHALRELGPGMGDLCLRVCCYLEGIELTERRLGWSARSGKIVLRLALMRLDRHYRESYGPGAPMIG